MKKTILLSLVILSCVILFLRFIGPGLFELFGVKPKAGIKVSSIPEAQVLISGDEVGKTPFTNENLAPGEYLVKLTAGEATWEGWVSLNPGTITVINRELSLGGGSSSGETLTLQNGSGVVITSSPSDSLVEIDGKESGKTPLSISDLAPGEHTYVLSHPGFLKRSIKAVLPEKMTLNLNLDLAVTEADLGSTTSTAVASIENTKLTVKGTPSGFLRVREKPSIESSEVGRVNEGETLILLEESGAWYKVRLPDSNSGYVFSSYVQKQK